MPNGTIARLLIDKGFGFIRDEGGIEHFFHRSSVRGAVFSCFAKDSVWSSLLRILRRDRAQATFA